MSKRKRGTEETKRVLGTVAEENVNKGVELPSSLCQARTLPHCKRFAKVFGQHFYAMNTFGEGSCFFHALAAAIVADYDQIQNAKDRAAVGLSLRNCIYNYTNEQMFNDAVTFVNRKYIEHTRVRPEHAPPEHKIPSFWEFKQRLEDKTVWADLVMISFVAFTFGYNLLFWNDVACRFYYGCDHLEVKNTHPTVFILWRDQTHFELLVHIMPDGTVERQFHWSNLSHRDLLMRVEAEYLGKST